ncbi:FecR family protein [Roseateles amylovorans]|uniref:FecR domain-containing protein n=1 Tax=Roseateles amylovorans TaxID=2978473 RepID=A0ABY6B2A5_9BURK|nr:FecR domain-containing protein [Roseateles amylovorans]UXH77420.1 FecR domain-containing protein [Roseateles amylovorans]
MMFTTDTNPLPDVLKDAQAWVRKLHSGRVTQWEANAFRRWVDAEPARLVAFQEAARQWRALGTAGSQLLRDDAAVARHHREVQARARPDRRAFLGFAAGGAGAAAVAAYAPLDLWPSMQLWGADERTAAGEQVNLAFGAVQVTLNTRTSVTRLQPDAQSMGGMRLIEGEAAVDTPRMSRPFRVEAGVGRMLVEAGAGGAAEAVRFEVRQLHEQTCVTCVAGTLRVDHPAGQRVLRDAQWLRYDARAISDIAAARAEELSAWRRGELVFQTTPLSTVIEEINRYRSGRVVLLGDAVRRKTVTARIKIAEIDTALLQIQHSFQLQARSLPSHILILS